ncbi:hypothetical protein ACOMHN_032737 [Nucella lapillus]
MDRRGDRMSENLTVRRMGSCGNGQKRRQNERGLQGEKNGELWEWTEEKTEKARTGRKGDRMSEDCKVRRMASCGNGQKRRQKKRGLEGEKNGELWEWTEKETD